jgi:HK97 family phage prohead protease
MSAERLYKFTTADFELKDSGEISGVAWPFDGKADRVGDSIAPEAFKHLEGSTLPMLFAHQGKDTIGVWSSLKVTAKGFEVSGRLLIDQIARAKEVAALIKSGASRFLSLGFIPKSFRRNASGAGRHFTSIDAFEISIVSNPANPGATITNFKDAERAARIVSDLNRAAEALRA